MAPRKSVLKLEELCWKSITLNFKKLRHEVQCLPFFFIDELYKRLSEIKCSKLPSKLFLHPNATRLLNLSFDLQPSEKLIKKISSNCKNLRRIVLPRNHFCLPRHSFTNIIINNPLLTHLDFNRSFFITNHDLFHIGNSCPQLEYLNLENATSYVTDECIDFLPTTLTFLNVNSTNITPKGCIVALQRLTSLKELSCDRWQRMLKFLSRHRDLELTSSIECLNVRGQNINLGNIIAKVFPKLRDIRLVEPTSATVIKSMSENKKLNLITRLDLDFAAKKIILICKMCPKLEMLVARISQEGIKIHSTTQCEFVPFKNLRKLELPLRWRLKVVDFKLLLENFVWLESLDIRGWRELNDGVIDDLLEANLLQKLESISLEDCNSITAEALRTLINSVEFLKSIKISSCRNVSVRDHGVLRQMISENNLDVSLSRD